MTRRKRALAFTLAAAVCAIFAASLADGYRDGVTNQYGALREVLVATGELPAGQVLGPNELASLTAARRVPARFVPAGAIARAEEAIGRVPAAPVPIGAYLLAAQLQAPQPDAGKGPELGAGRRPVQISVSGAEALTLTGPPEGSLVDVVVSKEPGGTGSGQTYIAAEGVRLLALGGAGHEGGSGGSAATLALTSEQALELISAEASARQIRLLPRP